VSSIILFLKRSVCSTLVKFEDIDLHLNNTNMSSYELLIFILFMYHIYFFLMSDFYKIMFTPQGYFGHLIFSIGCIIIAIYLYSSGLYFMEKGLVVMFLSPIIYNLCFLLFNFLTRKIYNRNLILTGKGINRTHVESRKKTVWDTMISIVLFLVTMGLPFLIREIFWA